MSRSFATQFKNFNLSLLVIVVISLASCGGKQTNSTSATPSPTASPESSQSQSQAEPAKKVFESGEAVPAGYLGYKIINSWFKDSFLYIEMAIVNTDKKERPVAAMKLIDETGKEYLLSDKGEAKEPTVGHVGMVPASQSKRATAVFEAPKGHEYMLKIPGFSATDEVQIKLKPAAKAPAR